MENRIKYLTQDVSHAANTSASVRSTDFPMEDGYNKVTGIMVVNKGAHTKFDVGINDHGNNTKIDPMDYSVFAPGIGAEDRFLETDISVVGNNKLIIMTNIRESLASLIDYQIIARLEKV